MKNASRLDLLNLRKTFTALHRQDPSETGSYAALAVHVNRALKTEWSAKDMMAFLRRMENDPGEALTTRQVTRLQAFADGMSSVLIRDVDKTVSTAFSMSARLLKVDVLIHGCEAGLIANDPDLAKKLGTSITEAAKTTIKDYRASPVKGHDIA